MHARIQIVENSYRKENSHTKRRLIMSYIYYISSQLGLCTTLIAAVETPMPAVYGRHQSPKVV